MIIHKDFKERFHNVILKAQNVVIVPYVDVDSVCATFILTSLFDADEVMYSVVPVQNWQELGSVFDEHKHVKHFILLNCGGFRSLLGFNLSEDCTIFVFDSRRPFHLDNVFNDDTVHLLCQDSEVKDLNLPEPAEIISDEDDSSEDEEESENDGNRGVPVAERIARRAIKRKKRNDWRANRDNTLWKYNQNSYVSTPVSVFLLEIAHLMSKATAAVTWAAATGLSSFHADHSISSSVYSSICMERMRPYLRQFGINDRNKADPTLRISFERDITLPLYRYWTLDESIRVDIYFICVSQLWTQRGRDRIKDVFATLGITLNEARNSFEKVDSSRRKEITDVLNTYMKTNFGTFFSYKGYARGFSSTDFARATALMLQFSDPEKPNTEMFMDAWRFLKEFVNHNGGVSKPMTDELKRYKSALQSLVQLVYDSVYQKRFVQTPSFIGLTILQHCTELDYLRSTHCLNIFMHVAIRVFYGTKKGLKRLRKPFFIAVINPVPRSTPPNEENYYLCSGCMPLGDILADPERKTFIPHLFKEFSQDDTLHTIYDSVDPNVILVREDSYAELFTKLDSRLPEVN